MSELVLPLVEVKKRLSELVDRIENHHDRVLLTRNGRPAALLLSPHDVAAMEETLDILSEPGALDEIREADAAIDRGEYLTADQLRAKYLAG